GIGWSKQHLDAFDEYVELATPPLSTADCFRFIFLRLLPWEDIQGYLFFAEVWLSLVDYGRREVGRRIGLFRAQIGRHLDEYLEITGYERPNLKFAQQTA
ncbi:uncharacterized protein BYT42DRAFT_482445, partial [Radiomyces spectabilis]|uniref:uncharacterized protein n=1 Tax=Radiomyces spectabilis TaxID=64574 RepID=UPI00221F0CD8